MEATITNRVESKLNEIEQKLDRVIIMLKGDDDLNTDGLAHQVKANKDYIEKDKKMKWVGLGVITTISTLVNWLMGK